MLHGSNKACGFTKTSKFPTPLQGMFDSRFCSVVILRLVIYAARGQDVGCYTWFTTSSFGRMTRSLEQKVPDKGAAQMPKTASRDQLT